MRRAFVAALSVVGFATAVFAQNPVKLDVVRLECGVVRAEITPIQTTAKFANLTFELLDPTGTPVAITSTPIDAGGGFVQGATLTPASAVVGKGFHVVLREGVTIRTIKPVAATTDVIFLDRARRYDLEVTFPCAVDTSKLAVTVTRDDKPVPGLVATVVPNRSTDTIATVRLNKPLIHKDTVTVVAPSGAGTVTVEKEVDFEAPADIEAATVYVGGKLELAEGSKPKVLVDLKYDTSRRRLANSIRWTHGPSVLVDAATQDSDGEGTATAGYTFRLLSYQARRDGDGGRRFTIGQTDFTPKFEADDGLNSRNIIADIRHQWHFAGNPWNVKPAFGLEGGTNLALKTNLEEFSDYNILRPTFDFYVGRTFEGRGGLKSIGVSLDTQSRFLVEEEPDVEPLPKSAQTADAKTETIGADGFKFYGKASLTFGFTEVFGISLDYEYGERPPLYGDNNKGGVSLVFSF